MEKVFPYFKLRLKTNRFKYRFTSKFSEEQYNNPYSKMYFYFFLYPFLEIRKIKKSNDLYILKFDVWEESSLHLSKIRRLPFLIKEIFNPKEICFVDIDSQLVKMAKRNIKFFGFRKYFIINGDIRSLPFPNEKFDIIIDFSTTDHLPLTDFKKTVKEVYRVLKENGVYLIYHLNSKYFNINRWNYYYKRRNKVGSVSIPSFPRKLERVESLIKKENFYVWKKEYCYPFYFDDNLFIHYIFLFNKLFNYLNSRLLFSYLNLPSFNLFFYLIAIKR